MTELMYIFLFIALVLAIGLLNSLKMETDSHNKMPIDTPFKEKWANLLYRYSYHIPFMWFIDEKEEHPKTKELKKQLVQANLNHLFNYRSFTVLKVGVMIASILIFLFVLLVINNGGFLAKVLFNVDQVSIAGDNAQSLGKIKIITFMVLLTITLIPNIYLRRRAKMYQYYYLKDIPVIQLFIILMLRSKKPVGEILYALSKINTRYKGIFDIGYRMYIRNREEGIEYIKESFGETSFKETMNVLKEIGEYSREDSIKLLENNMQQIIEKNNAMKRRGDLSKLVYSQSTIALPFVSIIVLCFIPLAVLGIQIFQNAGLGF